MTKVSYASLKLKTNTEVKTFDFNGNKIEVLQYLPVEDKIDLVDITLQKALEDRIYNPIKIEVYFNLNLIYLYTNISFSEKQKEDEYKLYNALRSSGLLEEILKNINEEEYNEIYDFIEERINIKLNYENSGAAVISEIIHDLPIHAQNAADILNGVTDSNSLQEVMNFAKLVNNGKEIE